MREEAKDFCGYGCGRIWNEEGGEDGFADCVGAFHIKKKTQPWVMDFDAKFDAPFAQWTSQAVKLFIQDLLNRYRKELTDEFLTKVAEEMDNQNLVKVAKEVVNRINKESNE